MIYYIVQRWSSQLPTYKHSDRNSSKYNKEEYSHTAYTYLLRQERNNLSTDGVQPLGDLRLSMQTHRQRQEMIIERPLNRHFIQSPPTKPLPEYLTPRASFPARPGTAMLSVFHLHWALSQIQKTAPSAVTKVRHADKEHVMIKTAGGRLGEGGVMSDMSGPPMIYVYIPQKSPSRRVWLWRRETILRCNIGVVVIRHG